MERRALLLPFIFAALTMASCEKTESIGFSLPKGDINSGKAAFVKFQCAACHTLGGPEDLRQGIDTVMTLPLGGETSRIHSYGELVTSVINPSHVLSKSFPSAEVSVDGNSKMRSYNDVMTVRELVDLVTFLQSQYVLYPYTPTAYPFFATPAW